MTTTRSTQRLVRTFVPPILCCGLVLATAAVPKASAAVLPTEVQDQKTALIAGFHDRAGYSSLHLDKDFWGEFYTPKYFPELDGDWTSPLMPDSDMRAIRRAILLFEAKEGALPHARYRVRYRLMAVPGYESATKTMFVELTRFNLGPTLYAEAAAEQGRDAAPPPASFGIGPHVSWRLAMWPIQGKLASTGAIHRKVLADDAAGNSRCLDAPCLSMQPITGPDDDGWAATATPEPEYGNAGIDDGPAAAADKLFVAATGSDDYGHPARHLAPYAPQLEMVVTSHQTEDGRRTHGIARKNSIEDKPLSTLWVRGVQEGTDMQLQRLDTKR